MIKKQVLIKLNNKIGRNKLSIIKSQTKASKNCQFKLIVNNRN